MKVAITLLVGSVSALLFLGMVMLYSAGMTKGGASFFLMQVGWCSVGLLAGVLAAWFDYRWLKKFAWIIFPIAVVLLSLVLHPHFGHKSHGARRWLGVGMARFQPSELAKLALIIALAAYAETQSRYMRTFWRGLVVPGVLTAIVLGLIFVEPDRGTTVLLAAIAGILLLIAGVRWLYLIPPAALAAVALAFSLWYDPVRQKRLESWYQPEIHKRDTGYQTWEAMVAFGNGGWYGLGLGNGRQKLGFVPENQTDFILSIIGEELGLIATLGVLLGFILLVSSGVFIAWKSRDTFGLLLSAGISFLIGLQALINIGVVTGAFPNKGLALPFISYGGSNLVLMLTCVGLLLSVARHTDEISAEQLGTLSTGKMMPSTLA